MAEGLALADVEALIAKNILSLKYSMGHFVGLALRISLDTESESATFLRYHMTAVHMYS
jgi:hypothetical protein